jgi:hypothetical protein
MFYLYLLHSISNNGFYIGFPTDAGREIRAQNGALHLRPNRTGQRFLRSQLQYYLKKFPARAAT